MKIHNPNKLIFIIALAAISTISYNVIPAFAQTNETQTENEVNYEDFHSNIQQIIGHIQMAEYNKINNNDSLTLAHTLHPIEEVYTLITIPLNSTDNTLNDTYANNLLSLSEFIESNNGTNEDFSEKVQESIDLSYRVISTVVPLQVISNTDHNITVIQDLLAIAGEEYAEGVENGEIVMLLEYQDGLAFIDRGYSIFNSTESITNEREEIVELFNNLISSVEQLSEPTEIDQTIREINHELSESLTTPQDMTELGAEENAANYISNIRQLLDEAISEYESNNIVKAKELVTTAYLDNFEHIERSIGDELAEQGEELLRENLRVQLDNNAPVEEIRQTVDEINELLDQAESAGETST